MRTLPKFLLFCVVAGSISVLPQVASSQSAEQSMFRLIRACSAGACQDEVGKRLTVLNEIRIDASLYSTRLGEMALAVHRAASRGATQAERNDIASAFRSMAAAALEPAQSDAMNNMAQAVQAGELNLFSFADPIPVSPS